jgi:hypothetical protein
MTYLYRHIRLDTNQPFYIGIGINNRAYSRLGRNKFWKNIVNKTEYRVDILLEDLTWEEACEKEREFITLYGRRDLDKGPLVNLTDGGDGVLGFNHREETKLKISLGLSGRTYESLHGSNADIEREKRKSHAKRQWKEKSETELKEISNKISNTLKEYFKQNPIVCKTYQCPHCNHIGKSSAMYRWHFDKCKFKLDS